MNTQKPIEPKAKYWTGVAPAPKVQKMLIRVQKIGAKAIKHYRTV